MSAIGDGVGEFYRRQGEKREQERIIKALNELRSPASYRVIDAVIRFIKDGTK